MNNQEMSLPVYSIKDWWRAGLLGLFLGLAIIIPGVSGATIAIIFGLYEGLLFAIGNIFKDFKSCFKFLLPILLGAIVGFVVGFLAVSKLFLAYPFILICLFGGLMSGAMPAVFANANEKRWRAKEVCLFIFALLIPISIGVVSLLINNQVNAGPVTFSVIKLLLYFVYGVVISLTQIVPGLSATAFLMMVGEFGAMLESLHLTYLFSNPLVLLMFVILALGFLVGIILFSKVSKKVIEKNKFLSFVFISGLSVGSVVSMFICSEMIGVYKGWAAYVNVWEIVVGVVLFALGLTLSLILIKREKGGKDKKVL